MLGEQGSSLTGAVAISMWSLLQEDIAGYAMKGLIDLPQILWESSLSNDYSAVWQLSLLLASTVLAEAEPDSLTIEGEGGSQEYLVGFPKLY
jgi:hypothetical protein